jgi:hypothetical protein
MEVISMKISNVIVKIVAALTVVAGAVYLAATYGDKIVAWAKNLLNSCKCCKGECECECDCDCEEACECACECAEEAAEEVAEEVVEAADETEVVAAEADFEG